MEWVIGLFILYFLSLLNPSKRTEHNLPKTSTEPTTKKVDETEKRTAARARIAKEVKTRKKEQPTLQTPSLTPRQQAIRDAVIKYNIRGLVHFTQYENLASIVQHGLVTRVHLQHLDQPSHTNDQLRLDGYEDSISLSISFPNYKMFYKYRKSAPEIEWAMLAIKPQVLWELDCAFCSHNAASRQITCRDLDDLRRARALDEMFEDGISGDGFRSHQRLDSCDPTDPQAEVLVLNDIPVNCIMSVGFENTDILARARRECLPKTSTPIEFGTASRFFNSRPAIKYNNYEKSEVFG